MQHAVRTGLGGHEHLLVSVAGDGGATADETRRAFETALQLISAAGFSAQHIVRSRLFARDAEARSIASNLRLEMLKGELRAASSSYIDPLRLPARANVAIDLVAVRGGGAQKIVREYEPVIAPPMFVSVGDMIYVSGCTDTSEGLGAQLAEVRSYIERNLAAAGASWNNVIDIRAHVSRKIDADDAWSRLTAMFPDLAGALSLSPVDGYSAPEKLIEIETTARL